MRFKLKKKLKKKKYSNHLFTSKNLIYQGDDNRLHRLNLSDFSDKTIMIHENLTVRISSYFNKGIVFYDVNDRQFFLGKEWTNYTEIQKEDSKIHWLPFEVDDTDISFLPLYYRESYKDKKLGFFNIITEEITWLEKVVTSKIIVFNITCLVRIADELGDFSRLSKFDLVKGKLLWDFNSKDVYPDRKRGYLDKIVGIYDNQLVLQPRGDRIIRLDLTTGKVVSSISSYNRSLDNVKKFLPDSLNLSVPKMDSKGILEGFFLQGMIYYSVNQYNEVEQHKNFRPGFPEKAKGWFIRTFELDDEKLIFIGTENLGAFDTVGIIDRNTREIVWTYILDKSKAGYRISFKDKISIDGKYFCVSDTEENVYFFEKED